MVNTRLAIGIHILSLVMYSKSTNMLTSEFIADSIGTNPVVIRRMTSTLKKEKILKAVQGNRGLILTKEPSEISFLAILQAVDPENELFSIHQNTNVNCPIGRNIEQVLTTMFHDVHQNTEKQLSQQNLQQVYDQLKT